jgi:hypothetical protein
MRGSTDIIPLGRNGAVVTFLATDAGLLQFPRSAVVGEQGNGGLWHVAFEIKTPADVVAATLLGVSASDVKKAME